MRGTTASIRLFVALGSMGMLTVGQGACASRQRVEAVVEGRNVGAQQRCRDAAARLEREGITHANALEIRRLAQCRVSAGRVLPAAWRTVTADSTTLQALMIASQGIRDSRIAMTLLELAPDTAKPIVVREAALIVLAGYVEPGVRGRVIQSTHPRHAGDLEVDPMPSMHMGPTEGDIAVTDGERRRITALLDSLASANRYDRIGYLARYLRMRMDAILNPPG